MWIPSQPRSISYRFFHTGLLLKDAWKSNRNTETSSLQNEQSLGVHDTVCPSDTNRTQRISFERLNHATLFVCTAFLFSRFHPCPQFWIIQKRRFSFITAFICLATHYLAHLSHGCFACVKSDLTIKPCS